MSSVFNEGMRVLAKWPKRGFDWVWHLTNVEFENGTLDKMMTLVGDNVAAVHSVFKSDHPHLNVGSPEGANGDEIPFVEWTAPLVSLKAWSDVGELDSELGYWGMDLDWSARAIRYGYVLRVCKDAPLGHEYLRKKDRAEHPITTERRNARDRSNRKTEDRLIDLWGKNWMSDIWPTHPKLAQYKGKPPRLYGK
jgi:GT2 family glycosyltransferase